MEKRDPKPDTTDQRTESSERPAAVDLLHGQPFNLEGWILNNMAGDMGSVGNKEVFRNSDFIFMIVKGPNTRNDHHIDPYDEIFHQLKGTAYVGLLDGEGKHYEAEIREGEVLLVKAFAPHSPRRPAGTVGLVIERPRAPGELDGIVWYCGHCHEKLHEVWIQCEDIETQLKVALDEVNDDEQLRTCGKCGEVLPDPRAPSNLNP